MHIHIGFTNQRWPCTWRCLFCSIGSRSSIQNAARLFFFSGLEAGWLAAIYIVRVHIHILASRPHGRVSSPLGLSLSGVGGRIPAGQWYCRTTDPLYLSKTKNAQAKYKYPSIAQGLPLLLLLTADAAYIYLHTNILFCLFAMPKPADGQNRHSNQDQRLRKILYPLTSRISTQTNAMSLSLILSFLLSSHASMTAVPSRSIYVALCLTLSFFQLLEQRVTRG